MTKPIIESNDFPFEYISQIAEKESWRKELHRPIYHLHKWWAKRLGSVFRAILLGCVLPTNSDFLHEFYFSHSYPTKTVLDPFMGSGTTIGEALKLGFTTLGNDINPVAAESVRVALTPINEKKIIEEFQKLESTIGNEILNYYKSTDSKGNEADVLYYFWVMQTVCIKCKTTADLFPNYILAQNAYPKRRPKIQVLCPDCNNIFEETLENETTTCPNCSKEFDFRAGIAKGSDFSCSKCNTQQSIQKSLNGQKPLYKLFAKLVLTKNANKEYLKVTSEDIIKYQNCVDSLTSLREDNKITLPNIELEKGYNTKQAINYGFKNWQDFFNDRQLLLLARLQKQIFEITDQETRNIFSLIFSGALEFNNLFVSYKGEGTGAVRHMFSHHILKPERIPIEANLWGTKKSSGSFSGLFKSKTSRIIEYRKNPKEVHLFENHNALVPLPNKKIHYWTSKEISLDGSVSLSCKSSDELDLKDESIDYIVTDPPFFDNVHYSELADFFYSWQKLYPHGFVDNGSASTRSINEVQDSDANLFSEKLKQVFIECHRVLKQDGYLIFSYHHSKENGWSSISRSILDSGFKVVNYHPIKSEMSVAAPKQQAREPIQIDIILVCKKMEFGDYSTSLSDDTIVEMAKIKAERLENAGFKLSKNDKKVILYGQLLSSTRNVIDENHLSLLLNKSLVNVAILT